MAPAEQLRVSIRVRPLSAEEQVRYPSCNQVQLINNEVRIVAKSKLPTPRGSVSGASDANTRPGTPPQTQKLRSLLSTASSLLTKSRPGTPPGEQQQGYRFDHVLGPHSDNVTVFDQSGCGGIVSSFCNGCNGTIFVYGQTGAGKTHTISAITDMAVAQVFDTMQQQAARQQYAIHVSVLELYNESIRDLISGRDGLTLSMSEAGLHVEGLHETECDSAAAMLDIVNAARQNRVVGETKGNAHSSRSHLITRIRLETLEIGNDASAARRATMSVLNLVDLAGSERTDKSGSGETKLRFKEATNINKGLMCLGKVVAALADLSEGKKLLHVPYRDSKLTRLLQDSLGGSARTVLVACITTLPEYHLEQTRHTLEFAARAGRVVCTPQTNEATLSGSPSAGEIDTLRREVQRLQEQLREQQQEADSLRKERAGSGDTAGSSGAACTAARAASPRSPRPSAQRSPFEGRQELAGSSPEVPRNVRESYVLRYLQKQGGAASATPGSNFGSSAAGAGTSAGGGTGTGASSAAQAAAAVGALQAVAGNGLLRRWASMRQQGERKPGSSGALGLDPPPSMHRREPGRRRQTMDLPFGTAAERVGGSTSCSGASHRPTSDAHVKEGVKDRVIRELLSLLQQHKKEEAGLRRELADTKAASAGLAAEAAAQEAQVSHLVERLTELQLQREREYEGWQGHMNDIEECLISAQHEASSTRSEMFVLQQQFMELKAMYEAQTAQLKQNEARLAALLSGGSSSNGGGGVWSPRTSSTGGTNEPGGSSGGGAGGPQVGNSKVINKLLQRMKTECAALRAGLSGKELEVQQVRAACAALHADLSQAQQQLADKQEAIDDLQDQLELLQHHSSCSMQVAGTAAAAAWRRTVTGLSGLR